MPGILIQYQVHPENTVLRLLKEFFPYTGITDRKGFETRIIQGHPLFNESVNQNNNDSEFPAIGIEHTSDLRTDSVGQNFSRFRNSPKIQEFFQAEKKKPTNERVASDEILDRLTAAPILNKFLTSVKSIVSIAGYSAGITAKNQNHLIYNTVDGLMLPICHTIMYRHRGVKAMVSPNTQTNIEMDHITGGKIWGFESSLEIYQTKAVYMDELPEYTNLVGGNVFDVWIKDSKTQFGKDEEFFSFGIA
jgi:hypothetical protein